MGRPVLHQPVMTYYNKTMMAHRTPEPPVATPQSLSQIRSMLAAGGLRPQKRLGQNFLIDGNLMIKLVGAAELDRQAVVLEVGGGTGSLTGLLLDQAAQVVTVELDRGLFGVLTGQFGDHPGSTLIHGDVLETKSRLSAVVLAALRAAAERVPGIPRFMCVANLPYQVASPLLLNALLCDLPFERLCFSVQREVADRIVAPPGTRDWGVLSVVLQACCDIRRVAQLPPQAFWPAPRVHSTALRLDVRPAAAADPPSWRRFAQVVRLGFSHRRKTLHYNLGQQYSAVAVQLACAAAAVDPQARAEVLPIDRWLALVAALPALETR